MAEITLNTRIVLRNDTSTNWNSNGTKTLLKGEPIIVWDGETPRIKIGDGQTTINDLDWAFINNADALSLITAEINKLSWVKNITITGTGNGLANATYSGNTLTITRGNFLTSHQDISGKVDKINIPAQQTIGLYKIAYNAQGQVTSSTAVTKTDITGLGIPGQDTNTTYTLGAAAGAANEAEINLSGSDSSKTTATLAAGGALTLSVADGKITISGANTTYTFAEGDTAGAFSVTPSGSSAQVVKIHGLGTAAYTDSDDYATSEQGTLASSALQSITIGNKTLTKTSSSLSAADGRTALGLGEAATKAVDTSIATDSTSVNLPTSQAVANLIKASVSGITSFKYEIVADLPLTGTAGVIYLKAHEHGDGDTYDEYIWITDGSSAGSFEKIGNTDMDLTGYLTIESAKSTYLSKTEAGTTYLTIQNAGTTYATKTELTNGLNGKQNLITTENKLAANLISGLATVATTGAYGDLTGRPGDATTSTSGLMTAAMVTKLNGIAEGATANTGTVTSVSAGGGLTGGPITTTGTISHATKPSTGSALDLENGSGLTFITGITIDAYGHIAKATKATVTLPTAASLGALTSITSPANSGIKVETKTGTTQSISLDTTLTYILDGGSAAA